MFNFLLIKRSLYLSIILEKYLGLLLILRNVTLLLAYKYHFWNFRAYFYDASWYPNNVLLFKLSLRACPQLLAAFRRQNLRGLIVTFYIYKAETIQKVRSQQIHIHTYDIERQTNTVWGKLGEPGMTGVCSDFHSSSLKFWRGLSMLSKLITLQNLKGLELDLDTLYGTCWVKLFIKAMGIDFDISIFLMSPRFGYVCSGEMKLIRTDAKKIIKKTKFTFIGLSLSFNQHPVSRACISSSRFPMPLWC